MVLGGLCILYSVCLLKVCHFYFLFFREDIFVTNKVDAERRLVATFWSSTWVLQMAMYSLAVFIPKIFFVRINPEDTT